MSVRVWHLNCTTESGIQKEVISSVAPTVCPDDSGHTIDSTSVRSVRIYSEDKIVEIKEENVVTGGHFQVRTVKLITPADSTSTTTVSWKKNVGVLAVYFVTEEAHRGDTVEVIVGEGTVIGTIDADVSTSATVLDVGTTVTDNAFIGGYVGLATVLNGQTGLAEIQNIEDLGEILDIDEANGQITVDIPTTNSFLAATPTYVVLSAKMVVDYEFGAPWEYVFGESKIGSSAVAAGIVTTIRYTNKDLSNSKDLVCKIEYLY